MENETSKFLFDYDWNWSCILRILKSPKCQLATIIRDHQSPSSTWNDHKALKVVSCSPPRAAECPFPWVKSSSNFLLTGVRKWSNFLMGETDSSHWLFSCRSSIWLHIFQATHRLTLPCFHSLRVFPCGSHQAHKAHLVTGITNQKAGRNSGH